jgi:hypothetical protein
VKADRSDVLVTTYQKNGQAMVALASWAKGPVPVKLAIDWKALGLDPAKARIEAPAIDKFQDARTFKADEPIPVEPGKGWLLLVR